jgi:predicted nucleic acid-binding protein
MQQHRCRKRRIDGFISPYCPKVNFFLIAHTCAKFIPEFTDDEIENGIKKGYLFQKDTKKIIDSKKWIHITNIEKQEILLYKELDKIVDYGEASCLAIAQMRGWIFLSDDDKARTYANENGIALSGTIGILRLVVMVGIIDLYEAELIHKAMIDNGYFSPIKRIADIL